VQRSVDAMAWCSAVLCSAVQCYAMEQCSEFSGCSGVVLYSAVLCNNAIHAVVKWTVRVVV
jgi:hypothetical protein